MVQDFTGNPVLKGDVVLYTDGHSALLRLGRVERTTAKSVFLRQLDGLDYLLQQIPGYVPGEQMVTASRVNVISTQMRHLDDIEITLHYKRAKEEGAL